MESNTPTSSLHQNVHIGVALVIGGCGFLGHHVVKTLLAEPTCTSISVMSRSPFKRRFPGVTYLIGDITKEDHVDNIVDQVKPNIIINTASPHAYIDHEHAYEYFTTNVDGNANILASAAKVGTVRAFVYTSSGPIIAGSGGGYDHADETHPTLAWPTIRKGDPYHLAKALGDKMVLEANGQNGLRTACIRPTALYGEGDQQMIEPVIGVLEDGQSNIWMGYNDVNMDSVYVGHVAEAEVLAIKGLLAEIDNPDAPKIGGEAFNITDDEPYPPWTFFRKLWTLAGDKTPLSSVWMIPPSVVMFMAHVAEWLVWAFSWGKRRPSMLKIERMEFLLLTRTYNIKKIRERLGFMPWANQPYNGVDDAVRGSLDWFIRPENHGPIKLPNKAFSWPEQPFRLISKTGADTFSNPLSDHYCIKNALIMAQTHNTFFRALNAIYAQCVSILPGTQDASDMLTYCTIVYDFIHQHQLHEEAIFFPSIEKATGIHGLMDINITEHAGMDAGLEKFRNYAEKTPRESYCGLELRAIIDSFASAFQAHNHAEIGTILSLRDKISSESLKDIDERMRQTAEKDSDMFKAGPLSLGCQDNTFIIDGDLHPFPFVPFIAKVVVDWVLSRRHASVWRFNPSNMYGKPRRFPPVHEVVAMEAGGVKEEMAVKVGSKGNGRGKTKIDMVVGQFGRFMPIFAALVSVWSLLTLLSVA